MGRVVSVVEPIVTYARCVGGGTLRVITVVGLVVAANLETPYLPSLSTRRC